MMNAVQKKCLLASAGMHGLLLCAVVFGAAFRSADKLEKIRPAEFIAAADIERALRSRPGLTPTPPPPPATVPKTAVEPVPPAPRIQVTVPPAPAPKPVQPPVVEPTPKPAPTVAEVRKPAPIKVEIKEVLRPVKGPDSIPVNLTTVKPAAPKSTVKVALEDIKVRGDEKAREAASNKAKVGDLARAQRQEAVGRVSDALANLQKSLVHAVPTDSGDSGNEEAAVDYGLLVVALYQNAWVVPQGVADSGIVAQASVTIGRDGRVIEARLVKSSGRAVLDKSIEGALRGVKFVAPFPAGDKERERTFIIDFNLKAKRLLG